MKTKNIVKGFGDKFSVKNVWRSLVFCLVIFGLIFISGMGTANADDEAKNCWIADNGGNRVVKLDACGSQICEFNQSHNSLMEEPVALAVNPADGSCWVACTYTNTVFKLSSQCEEELCLHGTQIHPANNGEVNPSSPCIDENGDCWLTLAWIKHIVKLDQNTGAIGVDIEDKGLASFEYPIAMAIDHCNHKLWVAEANYLGMGNVTRFSYTPNSCTFENRWSGFQPVWVDVDPTNGYCWVADYGNNEVAKISKDGTKIDRFTGFDQPMCVSVDPNTHCCWVADQGNNRVVMLSFLGTEECESSPGLFNSPWAVKVDPTFGTCWVSDTGNNRVMKLGFCAPLMQETTGFDQPVGIALDYRSVCVQVQYTDVGPISDPLVFSFAIITDNHLHTPPAYTHLKDVVDWINSNIQAQDIRFVMHLGDITDETMTPQGRYSCRAGPLLEVKQELDRLQVPYIPVIGNHDVWYDNNAGATAPDPSQPWFEKRPEEIFHQIFSPEYDYLGNYVLPSWTKALTPVWNNQIQVPAWSYFQNFAFDYMRYHFVGLDWVSRNDVYTSDASGWNRGWPDLHQGVTGGTWDWFEDYLSDYGYIGAEYENILVFAHYPLSFQATSMPMSLFTFDPSQYSDIVSFLSPPYEFNIDKWFAGHWHNCGVGFYPPCEEIITNNTGNPILTNVVTKSVTDFLNPEAPSLRIVRVHDDINVDFTYLPMNPTTDNSITFTGSGSSSNPIGYWDWDFGDGNTESGQTTTHPYPDPGIYKVTLTITDSLARKASISKAIDVGTKQLTSEYPDATAYNNARKLIFDPENAVLHLVYTTSPAIAGPSFLTYAKSTDRGNTWFEVTPNLLWGGHPALDVDTSDKPCVVENWAGFGSGFDAKRREKTLGWFSYDGVSDLNAVFGYASMVIDSDDTLHVAISYDDGTASEIRYYNASLGGRISDPEVVVSTTEECSFASIALDSSEKPHVIWQQDGKIYHSKRDGFWSAPVEISVPPCISGCHPSIVTGTSGKIYAVWEGNYQSGMAIGKAVWFSMYNGGWSTPESVSGVSIVAESYPQVVYKDGLLCVVWSDFTGSTHDVYHSSKKGTDPWSLPVDLSNTPLKEAKFPQAAICSVSPNELCVVWTEENSYDIQSRSFSFIKTATESGTAHFSTDNGNIQNLTAVPEAALPSEGKPNLQFPHGFFSFNITGLTTGQTVNVTIILPEDMPKITQYWKYHTPEGWYQIPLGSNDGDNIITVQLTDGGTGDDDGDANGIIVDQGGPGTPLKITETMYKNSITQRINVSKIRYKFTAVDEEWAAKWTNEILYVQKETKYSIAVYLNETGYVTRVDFERWGFPITEIPYGLAEQSLASLPPGFAIDP
jgi:DNA-binding beta-propeller fold protein YncE/PKD repeat protein